MNHDSHVGMTQPYTLKAGTVFMFRGVPVKLAEDTKVYTATPLDRTPITGMGAFPDAYEKPSNEQN